MPPFGTGWASGQIVLRDGAEFGIDVVKDTEFRPTLMCPDHRFSVRLWWQELGWVDPPSNQSCKLLTCHLGKRIQVAHLLLKTFTGTIKPKALICSPVNT